MFNKIKTICKFLHVNGNLTEVCNTAILNMIKTYEELYMDIEQMDDKSERGSVHEVTTENSHKEFKD